MGNDQPRARQIQQGGRGSQHKPQGCGPAQCLVLSQRAGPAGRATQPHLESIQIHNHFIFLRQPVQTPGIVKLLRRITQDGNLQRSPGRGGSHPQSLVLLGFGQGYPVRFHAIAHILGPGISKKHIVHGSAENVLPAARAAVPVIIPRSQPQVLYPVIRGRHPESDAQPEEFFSLGGGIHSDGSIDNAVAENRPRDFPGKGKLGTFRPELCRDSGHAGGNDGSFNVGIFRFHILHLHFPFNLAPDPGIVIHRRTVRLELHRIAGQNQIPAAIPEGGKHPIFEGGGKTFSLHDHGIPLKHGNSRQRRRGRHGNLLLCRCRKPLVSFALIRHMFQLLGGKFLHVFRELEPGIRQNHQGTGPHSG